MTWRRRGAIRGWPTPWPSWPGPNPPLTPEIAAILDCPKPVIAAVNGVALGIGMDFAVASDIRYASEKARFGQLFVKMGLMADVSGYWRLPQLVGPSAAAELLFTGDMIDAAEAHADRTRLACCCRPTSSCPPPTTWRRASPRTHRWRSATSRRACGERPAWAAATSLTWRKFVGNGLSRLFASDEHKQAVAAFAQRGKS